MTDSVRYSAKLRSLGAISCMVLLASCVGQSSTGGSPSATPAAFVPGQPIESVPAGPGSCAGTWTTAVSSVPVQASATLGPNKERLTCDTALQRLESTALQRCSTDFGNSSLYRNAQLLPMAVGAGDCECTSSPGETTCVVSTTIQCGHEELVCL